MLEALDAQDRLSAPKRKLNPLFACRKKHQLRICASHCAINWCVLECTSHLPLISLLGVLQVELKLDQVETGGGRQKVFVFMLSNIIQKVS